MTKVLSCRDVSAMYCAHEVAGETVEEIIQHAIGHVKAGHNFTDDSLPPEVVALWRSRIRDLPNSGSGGN